MRVDAPAEMRAIREISCLTFCFVADRLHALVVVSQDRYTREALVTLDDLAAAYDREDVPLHVLVVVVHIVRTCIVMKEFCQC